MNKKELAARAAGKAGTTEKLTAKVLNAVFESITEALEAGDHVQLIGFGSFKVKERAARLGRNPSNGEQIEIKAKKVPGFAAAKELKERVDQ